MRASSRLCTLLMLAALLAATTALRLPTPSRRDALRLLPALLVATPRARDALRLLPALLVATPHAPALAAKSCMQDCVENCNRVAPGSVRYCENSCVDYCDQDDRRDGLTGSVSSEGAEVGWLSAYDPQRFLPGAAPRAVPYGEDRPPALPDVFGVAPQLRKAITGGATPDSGGGRRSVEGQGGVQ